MMGDCHSDHLGIVLILCAFLLGAVHCNNPPRITVGSIYFAQENTALGEAFNEVVTAPDCRHSDVTESCDGTRLRSESTELFNITVNDMDTSDILNVLTSGSETEALVRLEPLPQSNGERRFRVLLKSRLDRDRDPQSRVLQFRASDGHIEVPGSVKLFIQDVNDNPPYFQNLPYRLELPERTNQAGSVVYLFTASDPDQGPGGTVHYFMTSQAQDADDIYDTTFVIRDPRTGQVWLERELDYENRTFYQYQVFAKDTGSPPCPGERCHCSNFTEPHVNCTGLNTTFTVTVKDVQDTPPFFVGLPYITQLYENATINTTVLSVSALDGDRGVPNRVNYSIENEEEYPFSMDAHTGVIRVRQPGLDADTPDGRSYLITVMATEMEAAGQAQFGKTSASTQVSITVQDVNNNSPQFAHHVYYATVQENTPEGVPVTINQTITVLDKDQNANSQFRLSVEKEGAPYLAFSTLPSSDTTVHGSTTVMITVNDSALLDFEHRQTVSFQIYAKETETREQFFNFTTVIVAILDMNDNSPYFAENQTTRVNVTENASSGKLLATLTATDRDSGAFGTVDYILENNFGGRFSIGKTSGEVKVNGSLDREGGEESFTLVVVARDNVGAVDSQRRSTRHSLMVTLQDLNDNDPAFLPHPPRVAVKENADVDTPLLTVKATDMDQGDNGKVVYHVVSIHSMATTAPQPPLFSVDEITGEVSVNVSLTDRPGFYNVTFEASDKGATPRWVRTSVVVDVKDVNNHPPVFVNPDEGFVNATAGQVPNVTIYEEEERGTFIIQLRATDADLADNGKVYFYLDPDLGGAFVNFQVDPLSGNLSNRFCLDADGETGSYQINLRAQDQGAQLSLSSVIPFTIHLRDIDDNPPEFVQKEPLVLAVKEQAADISVGFVNVATDQDRDPQNQVACYYLYGGEMVSSFQLHHTTGELRLLNKLDRDQTLQITLEVKVTRNCTLQDNYFTDSTHNSSSTNTSTSNATSSSSRGSSKRNRSIKSVLKVKVDVLDVNNHPPVFDKGALKVGLLYDVAVDTEVTNLVTFTSDKDTAEYSKHMYRLLKFQDSNPGPEPSLNSTFAVSANGSVVTRRLFRADEGGNFILTVQVYDIDGLEDTASLTIYLVSNLQRVRLVFNKGPNEVNRIKGDMVRKLGEVLNMTIVADKIATHINLDGTPDPQRTDVFVHARYFPSGEIVPTSELVSAFDYNARVFSIFQEYGVANVSPLEKAKEESEEEKEQKVFIIAIIVLAIVSIALVLVLVTSVRRYRRRLRAVTTSAYVTSKTMPDNEIPPGTNYYYTSENPLFGKDVKPEDFDRPEARVKDHHDDTDSLDDNAVDGGARSERRREAEPEEEEEEEQEVMMDMYDDDVRPSAPRNPLASVLREYDSQIAASKPTSSNTKSASPNTKSTSNNNTIHSAVLSPTSQMAASMLGGRSEVWRPSPLVGHVKADSCSGKCNDAFDYDLDDLQHSDI